MKKKRHPVRNFLFFVIFCALVYLGYYVFNDTDLFIISDITLVGNIHLTEGDIAEQLGIEEGVHYFKVNPDTLEERLLDQPWIKKCEVTRIFPNKLQVKITERQPVVAVYYSEDYLLIDKDLYVVEASKSPRKYYPVMGYQISSFNVGERINSEYWKLLSNTINVVYLINYKDYVFDTPPEIWIKNNNIELHFSDHFMAKLGDGENLAYRFHAMYSGYVTLKEDAKLNDATPNAIIIADHDGEPTFEPFGEKNEN